MWLIVGKAHFLPVTQNNRASSDNFHFCPKIMPLGIGRSKMRFCAFLPPMSLSISVFYIVLCCYPEEEVSFQSLQFCPFAVCQGTVLRTKCGTDRLHGAGCLGMGTAQTHRLTS